MEESTSSHIRYSFLLINQPIIITETKTPSISVPKFSKKSVNEESLNKTK
jgi:hypothetical protein